MLKLITATTLLIGIFIAASCSTSRIKFGPKYKHDKQVQKVDVPHEELLLATTNEISDDLKSDNQGYFQIDPPISEKIASAVDSIEQVSAPKSGETKKKKRKKRPSVFKKGMVNSGISSGVLAAGTIAFFLASVSTYLPLIGIALSILGIVFFVRGIQGYSEGRKTLPWHPREYRKEQHYGWATIILVINCVLVVGMLLGVVSIII